MMATVFDGISRHNPEGLWFRRHAQDRRLQGPRCGGATVAATSPKATPRAR
jgi:hypothetical protein